MEFGLYSWTRHRSLNWRAVSIPISIADRRPSSPQPVVDNSFTSILMDISLPDVSALVADSAGAPVRTRIGGFISKRNDTIKLALTSTSARASNSK